MRGGWGETVYHEVLNQGPGPGECMLGWWGGLVEPGPCVRYAVHTWVRDRLLGSGGSYRNFRKMLLDAVLTATRRNACSPHSLGDTAAPSRFDPLRFNRRPVGPLTARC